MIIYSVVERFVWLKKKIFFLNIIEKCNLSTVESNYTSIQNKQITQINKKKKKNSRKNKKQISENKARKGKAGPVRRFTFKMTKIVY